jgi:hypothetical protein
MPAAATLDDFETLLNESFELETPEEGTVVKGTVLAIEAGQAIIDIGYKMEGRVDIKEFTPPGKAPEIAVGDIVEVYLDRVENARGEAVLSREKARREEAWDRLEKAFAKEERVEGAIFGRVKGGFTVDLSGAVAFLPGSQVDVRPVRDVGPLMGQAQQFAILKMDRRRGNIVVSRRALSRDRTASPSLFSMRSTKMSTVSPSFTSAAVPPLANSRKGTRPSDLRPTSTTTKSLAIRTTIPLTTVPSKLDEPPSDSSRSAANSTLAASFAG